MEKFKYTAIVLAAGKGRRMQSDIPKQFMELDGRPVLYYSLLAFENSRVDDIILVTGSEEIEYCKNEIVQKYGLKKVRKIIQGGAERYHSVFCGLKEADGADYVLIHDGARPLVTEKMIHESMEAVVKYHACVCAMPAKDTIKIADEHGFAETTPDRSRIWMVQTPQTFDYNLILDAYDRLMKEEDSSITDDAMVVEKMTDTKVRFIYGRYENIKITTPEDLKLAKVFLLTDENSGI